MMNGNTPEYLCNLLPNIRSNFHCHFTRQSNNFTDIRTRTSLYSNYFLPSTIKLWNNLSIDIRNSGSLNIFKSRIGAQNEKRPLFYNAGSRMGQILHARMRMNSSCLNEHLFRRSLVDSPNCTCGQIESNRHFLLYCHKYSDLRRRTIFALNFQVQIDLNLFLYGSDALTLEQNTEVFLKVQSYILKSKRFVDAYRH